ncbi:MAG TPA: YdeI/OmpD-associated family protein, partial [Vicinamibacterales bacterium]|nr:YdeI/OmpD-associated family protein [Vicinamibacterales bacterium]
MSDLPSKKSLVGYVKKAIALNEAGISVPRPAKRASSKPIRVPPDLAASLKRNSKARATFEDFSASNKREYIDWITEATAKETRVRRLQTAVEWMAQGKSRNWKYERKQ